MINVYSLTQTERFFDSVVIIAANNIDDCKYFIENNTKNNYPLYISNWLFLNSEVTITLLKDVYSDLPNQSIIYKSISHGS